MHRSGSSLTTSWLASCGLNIHDGNLIGADAGNPKGHFEDNDFVDLHKSEIQYRKPDSEGWKIQPATFLKFKSAQLCRARQLIEERNKKFVHWGWKDPRTTIFLKQWKEIIPDLKALLIWRPCLEVVNSLVRRSRKVTHAPQNKISVPEAVKMWICYNQRLCEYKREYPTETLLFSIYHLISYPYRIMELINAKLQLNLNYQPFCDIFENSLLKGRTALLTDFWAKAADMYYKDYHIEKKLKALSDI